MNNLQRYELDNGLRVFLSQNNGLHTFATNLSVNYGFFNTTNRENGLAHLIEHMISEGTSRLNKKSLRAQLDKNTTYWNAQTDDEFTSYDFKALSFDTAENLFYLIKEMVFDSNFPESSIISEKSAVINEVMENFGSDFTLEDAIAFGYLFKKEPSEFLGGNPRTVKEFRRKNLMSSYLKYYSPQNSVLSVTGNFEGDKAKNMIKETFGSIDNFGKQPNLEVYLGKTPYREINLKNFNPYKGQSHILIGMKIPGSKELYKKSETSRAGLQSMSAFLSNNLMEELRDKLGIVYDAGAEIDIGKYSGCITVYAQVKNEDLETGKKAIYHQIDRIINGEVTENTVEGSKVNAKIYFQDIQDYTLDYASKISSSILKHGRSPGKLYKEYDLLDVDGLRAAGEYFRAPLAEDSVLLVSQ
jgi:predicted Zn-dependent peptidase